MTYGQTSTGPSVVDQERDSLNKHPWSIGGGGASELKALLDSKGVTLLDSHCTGLGFGAITGEDDIYLLRKNVDVNSIGHQFVRGFVEGDTVRDWQIATEMNCIFPYNENIKAVSNIEIEKKFWPNKVGLRSRVYFGKTQAERGMQWYEYGYISKDKCASPLLIAFAFVATHNHFVLDRGGKLFKQSAPVIELPATATESDHFALLGLLNSSTACFWARQTFFSKRGDDVGRWGEFMEFDGTKLKKFPLPKEPSNIISSIAEKLDKLGEKLSNNSPAHCFENINDDLESAIKKAETEDIRVWAEMIALQEELDWYSYSVYGLTSGEDLCYKNDPPEVKLGERTFEIHLARKVAAGKTTTTWFERHNSTPVIEIPCHWPADYKSLVEKRLQSLEQSQSIKLVEQPEYKRRWNRNTWDVRLKAAAQDWLLDQCEQATQHAELQTCAQLADRLRRNADVMRVAEIYSGTSMVDLQSLLVELIDSDNVPQMAAARLKPIAMPKFHAWQETWDKQRLEDAIDAKYGVDQPLSEDAANDAEKVAAYEQALQKAAVEKQQTVGDIPLPPQYKQTDFRKPIYWKLRGKLDVAKERFFSLPGGEKDGDSTLVIGWAGLNHMQRAQAIASWYLERKDSEGLSIERLLPMLVALDELVPWLKQWHNEIDPEFGERMGDYYEGFLLEELRHLQVPHSELADWQPAATVKKTTKRQNKAAQ